MYRIKGPIDPDCCSWQWSHVTIIVILLKLIHCMLNISVVVKCCDFLGNFCAHAIDGGVGHICRIINHLLLITHHCYLGCFRLNSFNMECASIARYCSVESMPPPVGWDRPKIYHLNSIVDHHNKFSSFC